MKTFYLTFMRMMALALLVGATSHVHAQEQSTLVIWHADGTKTRVELSKKPEIYFSNHYWDGEKYQDEKSVFFYLSSEELDLRYPATNVLKFTYEKTPSTDINAPQDGTTYRKEGERIYFDESVTPDKIALYSSNGVKVPVQIQQTERGFSLSLSGIPSGVYMLSVNGKTSKFVKK